MNTLISSANNIRFNRFEALLMSLMYSKNNRGRRIEPGGTLQESGMIFPEAVLVTTKDVEIHQILH